MKARWVLWVYPRAWRERYRAEMEALMEDSGSGAGDAFDLVKEGIRMRVLESWSFAQLAVVLGVAGVLVAAVSWMVSAPNWLSQAELKISSANTGVDEELRARLQAIRTEIFSRTHLSGVIQSLDLYPDERKTQPLEDVIAQMHDDLHLDMVRTGSGFGVKISFLYPDRLKAQQTVESLVSHFEKANTTMQLPGKPQPFHAPTLDVLDPPSLPMKSEFGVQRRSMGWLLALLFGGAGVILAAIGSLLVKAWRFRPRAAALAAVGIAVGAGIGMAEPELISILPLDYVSHADLEMLAPGSVPAGDRQGLATDRFAKLQTEILSTDSLSQIILDPRLRLYERERKSHPLADAINRMRRDIRITLTDGSYSPLVSVSFRYRDRFKAQQVVQALISMLHYIDARTQPQALAATTMLLANIDVTDPPSAGLPFKPNRLLVLAIGLGSGLVLAAVTKWLMRARVATV